MEGDDRRTELCLPKQARGSLLARDRPFGDYAGGECLGASCNTTKRAGAIPADASWRRPTTILHGSNEPCDCDNWLRRFVQTRQC